MDKIFLTQLYIRGGSGPRLYPHWSIQVAQSKAPVTCPAGPDLIHHRYQPRRPPEPICDLPKIGAVGDVLPLHHSSQWLHHFFMKVKIEFS